MSSNLDAANGSERQRASLPATPARACETVAPFRRSLTETISIGAKILTRLGQNL